MFNHLTQQPADPILGVGAEFRSCASPDKVNLSVGVYADDTGKLPTFKTVRNAEKQIWDGDLPKSYLPILGTQKYCDSVRKWLTKSDDENIVTAYSSGGTGAIRLLAELCRESGYRRVWLASPTWGNHFAIFWAYGDRDCQIRPYGFGREF